MQVNLTKPELEMIEAALDAYEHAVTGDAMMGSLLGVMLSPKEDRENEKSRISTEMEKARNESHNRRVKTTLLRAKLYAAMALESEHVIEEAR